MTRDLIADIGQAKYWQESIPWGRIGKPEDLVGAAIFLASDEAEYITGVTIFVDGGFIHRAVRTKNIWPLRESRCGNER